VVPRARTALHGGRGRDERGWRVRLRRGLEEEDGPVCSAVATSGTLTFTGGPYVETKEFLGGFAVVDVADGGAAKLWAGKLSEACGWPHEVRRFKS
jgi:YCII-related domain